MKNEDLLPDLGRVARNDVVLGDDPWPDPRWDDLAAGDLSAAEEKRLRAETMALPGGERAWEGFKPFAEGFEHRVLRRVQESRVGEAGAEPAASEPVANAPTIADSAVVPLLPRRSRPRPAWLAPTLAAAAALVAMVGWWQLDTRRDIPRDTPHPGLVEPLPAYSLEVSGVSTMRSDPRDSVFLRGKRFTLVLRPEREVDAPVAVYFFIRGADGGWREWQLVKDALEGDAKGSFRVSAVLDSSLEVGGHIVALAVGAADSLPTTGEILGILADGGESPSPGWWLLRREIEVAEEEPLAR